MASTDDTQRAAIRERKRQAHVALRERHQRQEAAQTAAFSALDRLARHSTRPPRLAADDGDPLERAGAVTTIAAQLTAGVDDVRRTANELVAVASMTQQEVAELLGTRPAFLFPRPRPAIVRPDRRLTADRHVARGGRRLNDWSLLHVDRVSDRDGFWLMPVAAAGGVVTELGPRGPNAGLGSCTRNVTARQRPPQPDRGTRLRRGRVASRWGRCLTGLIR